MNRDFWKERWLQNEIGFHMDERHDYLQRFFHRLHVGPGTVFVPLCGKSPDLLWLRQQGARVLGVELSEIAVRDFFAENHLEVETDSLDGFKRSRTEGVTLLQGDLFGMHSTHLDGVRGVYDRGSLVALPPEMRTRYAEHLCALLPSDSRILLISYDYNQEEIDGPPFSVPMAEIEALFGRTYTLELLAEQDAMPTHNVLREKGISKLTEFACLLTHR